MLSKKEIVEIGYQDVEMWLRESLETFPQELLTSNPNWDDCEEFFSDTDELYELFEIDLDQSDEKIENQLEKATKYYYQGASKAVAEYLKS